MFRLATVAACLVASTCVVDAEYPVQKPVEMYPPEGCTAMLVDPHGSLDGGMTTHTNDCHECDTRIAKIPAKDWPEGSQRPVFKYRSQYPRYLGYDFGPDYTPENTDRSAFPFPLTEPIGHIPQVAHTYAYIDGNYGIENEWQVAMGESTCAARIVSKPVFDGGKALLDVSMLSRLCMERTKTAKECVELMGALAEKYGYYGAEWRGPMAEGEAGEALMVSDPKEGWVFHILPDSTGASAIWAAQRIAKGHIAVCANAFFIKEIDFKDKDNFLYSSNIVSDAEKMGFYDKSFGDFHFTKTYGLVTTFDAYSFRRAWRVLSIAAPSRNFPSNSTIATLPFSVKLERTWNKTDLMWLQRDHFEGTEFATTEGLASGPYGNPTRYDPSPYFNRTYPGTLTYPLLFQGHFERTISIHRTIYSFVTLSRSFVPDQLSLVWFGAAIPHATYYQPVFVRAEKAPKALTVAGLHGFDRRATFWASTALEGWLEKCYRLTIVDVAQAQRDIESRQSSEVHDIEKRVIDLLAAANKDTESQIQGDIVTLLTEYSVSNGERSLAQWWTLFEAMITKYHDGFVTANVHVDTIFPIPYFYPFYWLKTVDYWTDNKPDYSINTWQYAIHPPTLPPKVEKSSYAEAINVTTEPQSVLLPVFLTAIVFMAVGVFVGWKLAKRESQSKYTPIQHEDA